MASKSQRRARRQQREAQQAEKNRMAMESWSLSGVDIVDRRDYLPTGFGFADQAMGYGFFDSTIQDRRDGRNSPFIEDVIDANHVRGLARLICNEICPGLGILENLKGAIVGTGYIFRAKAKKHANPPKALLRRVQAVIDRFLDINAFTCSLDRELLTRARRDGEYFLAHHGRPNGDVWLRELEPEQVNEPGGGYFDNATLNMTYAVGIDCDTNWSFGIQTAQHDVQRVFGYAVQWPEDMQFDYYPATYVVHQKQNVDRNVKRGLSDFYPAWRWLKQQQRLLENTSEGAAELAAIAYIIQYAQATQADVLAMRRNKADVERTRRTAGGGTQTDYIERKSPGSKLNVPAGQEYLPGPMGAERGQAFLEVVQGMLRQIATRWCMTEGMISGDDSNNNMASSIEAGGRWFNYIEGSQGELGQAFVRSIWIAVRHAYNCGKLATFGLSWEEVCEAISIEAKAPQIEKRETLEREQVRALRNERGVLSLDQWKAEVGVEVDEQDADEMGGQATGAAAATSTGVDDVAKTALNGAQVTSLQEILTNAAAGMIPVGSVKPMIIAAFPTMSVDLIDQIVSPLEGFTPSVGPDGKPVAVGSSPPTTLPPGEFSNASRLQWRRNLASIREVLDQLKRGEVTATTAKELLGLAGVAADRADRLIADIADNGQVDDPELQATLEAAERPIRRTAVKSARDWWEGYP